jgi:transcriptional regulator with XRE-family HTH domain
VEDIDFKRFFRELGGRFRVARLRRRLTQEDVIRFGLSARHYQQIEAGRPITLKTLVRVCLIFGLEPSSVLRGLERELRYDRALFASSSRSARRPRRHRK